MAKKGVQLNQKKAKADKANNRAAKRKLQTKTEVYPKARSAFQGFIRKRDARFACISCGDYKEGGYSGLVWNGGHFHSVGANKSLVFDERNCHKQCIHCNSSKGLSGNPHEYRRRLPERIGQEVFDSLEFEHYQGKPKKYTIEDYRFIIKKYNALARLCDTWPELIRARQRVKNEQYKRDYYRKKKAISESVDAD